MRKINSFYSYLIKDKTLRCTLKCLSLHVKFIELREKVTFSYLA